MNSCRTDNQIRAQASQTIEERISSYGQELVELYFKHVHPVYPVIVKAHFVRAYATDKLAIPASL
jgi:hypothetical protein